MAEQILRFYNYIGNNVAVESSIDKATKISKCLVITKEPEWPGQSPCSIRLQPKGSELEYSLAIEQASSRPGDTPVLSPNDTLGVIYLELAGFRTKIKRTTGVVPLVHHPTIDDFLTSIVHYGLQNFRFTNVGGNMRGHRFWL